MNKTLVIYGNIKAETELINSTITCYKINNDIILDNSNNIYTVEISNGCGKYTLNVNDDNFIGKDTIINIGTEIYFSISAKDIKGNTYIKYISIVIDNDIENKPTIQKDIYFTKYKNKVICHD